MTPEILKYIQRAQAITLNSDSDLKTILVKDSIYNAAGLSAFNLFDEVNLTITIYNRFQKHFLIFRLILMNGLQINY